MPVRLSREVAKKVLEVVDAGLVKGLGSAVLGKMCVEAAVNYALGLPHGDQPECVGEQVREFKIVLNDAQWLTNEDRTKGMRKLAIAQLGSDTINQDKFLKLVGLKCMTRVLPVLITNELVEGPYKEKIMNDTYYKFDSQGRLLLVDETMGRYTFLSPKNGDPDLQLETFDDLIEYLKRRAEKPIWSYYG